MAQQPFQASMTKRKLPIGIQTFREIREDNCYYVDKTAYIHRLLNEGKHFFLSRPRRFGKSLFLDTCKELFESNEPLFEGLYIHDRWDWSVRHPVLRLDFSSGTYQGPDDLREEVSAQLNALEEEAEVIPRDDDTAPARFRRLMKVLHERSGQRVAVLVDECDKPILDALEVLDIARANRDFLRGLYSTIKDSDAHICFTLLTGVSKFSMAGPATRRAIEALGNLGEDMQEILPIAYRSLQGVHFLDICKSDRSQVRFIRGWLLNRAS